MNQPTPSQAAATPRPPLSWRGKFACALRGVRIGAWRYGRASFAVHVPAAIGVAGLAMALGVGFTRCALLALCVGMVLAAELLNSAIEALARAITDREDPHVRDALDVASGAVLVAAGAAAVAGAVALFC